MIQIKDISKRFDNQILDSINIDIPDGAIVGLIGTNGAGKSTLLRMLAGIYEPDSGEILFDGQNVYNNVALKKDIYFLSDEPYFSLMDTPDSLVRYYRFWFNYDFGYIDFLSHLNKFNIPKHRPIYKFSKGMKRQTSLALGIALKPKYLFLDEAFDGVDPVARKELKQLILKTQEQTNMTVIISSHSLRELEDICDCFLLINKKGATMYNDISEFTFHKYVMAFDNVYTEKQFLNIKFASFERENKIITCITTLDYEHMAEAIKNKEPKILEEVAMSAEESFITKIGLEGEEDDK